MTDTPAPSTTQRHCRCPRSRWLARSSSVGTLREYIAAIHSAPSGRLSGVGLIAPRFGARGVQIRNGTAPITVVFDARCHVTHHRLSGRGWLVLP